MTTGETRSPDPLVTSLTERAKELQCLYRVHEITHRVDLPLEEVGRRLVEALPPGWQYPETCRARVTLEGAAFASPGFVETEWRLAAEIRVFDEPAGTVEVCYLDERPAEAEGPFLSDERKLIDTIAQRLGLFLMQRRLETTLNERQVTIDRLAAAGKGEWRVLVDFLRRTDQNLLLRISRRMINYLCWNGVDEAQRLLQRFSAQGAAEADGAIDDNRPTRRKSIAELLELADEAFSIAAARLGEPEIITCIQGWLQDDRSGFLAEAVENQCTSIVDIGAALERYHELAVSDQDLSRALQVGLRVSLVRRFFTDDLEYINAARNYVEIADFHELAHHVISPPASHGKLGGKSAGLFLASQIVKKSTDLPELAGIRMPRTWYVASDGFQAFAEHNHLEDVYNRKYLEIDQVRREYPHIVQLFKNSHFPSELLKGLSLALDDFGEHPLVVRSSSLLEDRIGAAFSGKYKSLFLANQGTKAERMAALTDAIAEVYASLFGPDPIEYRAERGMLDLHEEMGVMIQEVVGTRVGRYFMPAFAGVAFSNNEFRWSPRIKREDGLLRLVPGLGTRAVDRVSDDYPVLVAPGQPGLRANVTPEEVVRYAPRKIDLINLESRRFETVEIDRVFAECGREYPMVGQIASTFDADGLHGPIGLDWDPARDRIIVTFDGLIARTPFVSRVRSLLARLRETMGVPVDLEFASDGTDLFLLQCRPQSFSLDATAAAIPHDVSPEQIVFSANRYVSNGRVPDVTHLVYVDPERYYQLATLDELRSVGRAVSRLNKLLPKRQFILMGPGRWGSRGDIKLGVSVTYSDINNTAALVEIATKRGNYVPDLSFGTHFFQDLVESGIRYLPLYPGSDGVVFDEAFFRNSANILGDLAPDFAGLADTLRVIDVPRSTGGLVLRLMMNADLDEAVAYLAPPSPPVEPAPDRRRATEQIPEEHWRWRLRMAERIAAELDPARFGVRAVYVIGSTKNASAGPASDIDLLIHADGDADRRRALETWLEGWSLCLGEMNYLRTGSRRPGLLDVHLVTDREVADRVGYAAKIGAVTDQARPLALGRPLS